MSSLSPTIDPTTAKASNQSLRSDGMTTTGPNRARETNADNSTDNHHRNVGVVKGDDSGNESPMTYTNTNTRSSESRGEQEKGRERNADFEYGGDHSDDLPTGKQAAQELITQALSLVELTRQRSVDRVNVTELANLQGSGEAGDGGKLGQSTQDMPRRDCFE